MLAQGCVYERRCADGVERRGDDCVRVNELDGGRFDAGPVDANQVDANQVDAPSATCGDGRVEGDEPCDDGANGIEDGCHDDCTIACDSDADCPLSTIALCDGAERCTAERRCVAFDPASCDDSSACTADSCDSALGCVNALIDADSDGEASIALGACGTDCDDTDSGRSMGATELCNGVDDDCDSQVDDGFECAQSADVPCTSCGHAGRRRCGAACTWTSECFDFLFSELYEGTDPRLTHACGAACDESGAWCLNAADSPCESVSGGPDVELPPGRYQAEFRIAYSGSGSSVRLSVYDGSSRLGFADHSTLTFNSTITVPFMVAACGNSVRVRAASMAGSALTFFSVRILRIGEL